MSNLRLPFGDAAPDPDSEPALPPGRLQRDEAARRFAVDPRVNVALEASAGTGKTRVLVDRYVNLLKAGVEPAHVLAMTFTRKAATEMRERIVLELTQAAERGDIPPSRWRELRDRMHDITVSTIDAFCLSLLREFPLEADLDPGFDIADDAEVPRLVEESLDRALRTCRALARHDENVGLVFAQLGDRRARLGLASLLARRLVAPAALGRYVTRGPQEWTVQTVASRGASALIGFFGGLPGGFDGFRTTGPPDRAFALLGHRVEEILRTGPEAASSIAVYDAFQHARRYFLRQDGEPRAKPRNTQKEFSSIDHWRHHKEVLAGHASGLVLAYTGYRRDLNVLVSRGVWRMYHVAEREYRATLDAHAVLDFSDLLFYTLRLLGQMEEFAQSRYRLESRYQHVLVDEFQDTSRPQWDLVALLIQAWGEGAGLSHHGPLEPSVFIVGDRKQSIYGFRDADVSVLTDAGRYLGRLRQGADVRRSINRSFRSVPGLLSFVNDVCYGVHKAADRSDAFVYSADDEFPLDAGEPVPYTSEPVLGAVMGEDAEICATATAVEIARLVATGAVVRDKTTGLRRAIRSSDVAILFRTRETHREFERALDARGLRSYVYKGLGFFDADEIKDALALLWYLAEPYSALRAAAWLRSRFVRLSDEGLRILGPSLTGALASDTPLPGGLSVVDAHRLAAARTSASRWRRLVDRLPPAELFDLVLRESAYAFELRGSRLGQARENLKKLRVLLRRMQNRGYLTLSRLATHLDRLAVGDESNAAIDAADAVNLMTIHAAKGLEFPVVFVVNISRGTGNRRPPIRVSVAAGSGDASVSVGDFQSEADEDRQAKEQEESKRLLYVALTRARDRLYLASLMKDGAVPRPAGSLTEVMPSSLIDVLADAARADGTSADSTVASTVTWRGPHGAHVLAVCSRGVAVDVQPDASSPDVVADAAGGAGVGGDDDLAPLEVEPDRWRVAELVRVASSSEHAMGGDMDGSDAVLGTVVHRLLQRLGSRPDMDSARVAELAGHLLGPNDDVAGASLSAFAAKAADLYRQCVADPEVAGLLSGDVVLHEVPFAVVEEGRIVRGVVDCVVQTGPSQFTILEFKTGRPQAWHQRQLEAYQRAVLGVFPGGEIAGRLVYASLH